MATRKRDDELIQHDNKMRIWTRSGKFRKVEKTRIVYGLETLHDADANDNINDCVAPHDASTNDHFHWHPHERSAHSLSQCSLVSVISSAHAPWLKTFEFHVISIVMSMWAFLLDLTLPFYFLHYLTHFFFFLQFLKFVLNLHTPPNESMDSTDEFSLSTHELPMESRAKVEPGSCKQSIYTHFPKDPNCDICLKTKIISASCSRSWHWRHCGATVQQVMQSTTSQTSHSTSTVGLMERTRWASTPRLAIDRDEWKSERCDRRGAILRIGRPPTEWIGRKVCQWRRAIVPCPMSHSTSRQLHKTAQHVNTTPQMTYFFGAKRV